MVHLRRNWDFEWSTKVKGGHATHLQLAEEWILRSCKILENPYSSHAYVSAIEEAEQFLVYFLLLALKDAWIF
ncbi:hypothetical protein C2S52_013867 [Perilla frutescens var. hirtella]|nr:hypothetical protein C2S52_013867 [Perilla frutescens var. hirtella]